MNSINKETIRLFTKRYNDKEKECETLKGVNDKFIKA